MDSLVDRDPADETWPHHSATPDTGLCERPYCDDAALPGEEFCADCLREILALEEELIGE